MGKRKRILVVEDEKEMVRALQRSLTMHGYEVVTADNGESALASVTEQQPDVVLLDLGLPGISGLDVCKSIRAHSPLPPIIVLSVRSKERDKIRALDLGADDYVAKPFGMNEVLARIRVALRHASYLPPLQVEPRVSFGPLEVDIQQQYVLLHGREIKLTPTECSLLKALLEHRGKILTQQMLLKHIWGNGRNAESHYLHVYISHLRRKIEPDPAHPRFLHTISGVGYRFQDTEEAQDDD